MTQLYDKVYNLFHQWLSTEEEDKATFQTWINKKLISSKGALIVNTIPTFLSNVSDITSLCLEDNLNPFLHSASHDITYENGYTKVHITSASTETGVRYYLAIPFTIPSNQIYISVDFYTTGMGNDDFGVRITDKDVMDNSGSYNSYGAWIITGQGRLAYGYGGYETHGTLYGDNLGSVANNVEYNYTMKISDTTAYFCLTRLSNNTVIAEQTYNRTDSYSFNGKFYLYIGGGKFTSGSNDKSIYLKNLTIKELTE